MKTTFSIVILLLFSVLYAQSFGDYFPLNVGDYWIQHGDEFQGGINPYTFTMEIEGIDQILGEDFARKLNCLALDDGTYESSWWTWLRATVDGIEMGAFGDTNDVSYATLFDPPILYIPSEAVNLGYTWQLNIPQMGGLFSFENVGVGETVTVPAGTFTNCLLISLVIEDSTGTVTQTNEYHYAENVGEVRNEGWSAYWEGMLLELIEYGVQTSSPQNVIPNAKFLLSNYPNPLNPETTIRFTTENTEKNTEIVIYNLKGQRIKQFSIFNSQSSILWDGRDENNQPVSSGIYFYKLKAGEFSQTKKMILLK